MLVLRLTAQCNTGVRLLVGSNCQVARRTGEGEARTNGRGWGRRCDSGVEKPTLIAYNVRNRPSFTLPSFCPPLAWNSTPPCKRRHAIRCKRMAFRFCIVPQSLHPNVGMIGTCVRPSVSPPVRPPVKRNDWNVCSSFRQSARPSARQTE